MNRYEFNTIVHELQSLYGKNITVEQLEAWWQKFKSHSGPALSLAIERACREAKTVPNYGQILKHLGAGAKTDEEMHQEWLTDMAEIAKERGQSLEDWLAQRQRIIKNRGVWCD